MPKIFLDNIVLLMLLVSGGLMLVWYIIDRKERQKASQLHQEGFEEKGYDTLRQANKKAQAVLEQAEIEGIKVVADSKFYTQKLEEQIASQLQSLTQHYQIGLSQSLSESQKKINEAEQEFIKAINELRSRSEQFEKTHQLVSEERMEDLLEKLQSRLWDFLVQIQQKSMTSIDLELRSSRQLIETYKQEQLRLVDENIVAILERTLSHVLVKKLSLKDQLDLVYEALEKAKIEKFIAWWKKFFKK